MSVMGSTYRRNPIPVQMAVETRLYSAMTRLFLLSKRYTLEPQLNNEHQSSSERQSPLGSDLAQESRSGSDGRLHLTIEKESRPEGAARPN